DRRRLRQPVRARVVGVGLSAEKSGRRLLTAVFTVGRIRTGIANITVEGSITYLSVYVPELQSRVPQVDDGERVAHALAVPVHADFQVPLIWGWGGFPLPEAVDLRFDRQARYSIKERFDLVSGITLDRRFVADTGRIERRTDRRSTRRAREA